MKSLKIFSVIVCVIFFSCKNEIIEKKENHIDKLNMYGKIKSFKEISYSAILKKGKIVKGEEYRGFGNTIDPIQDQDYVINFDTLGRITDYTFFYYDWKISKKDTCIYYSKNDIEEYDPASTIYFLYKQKSKLSTEYVDIPNVASITKRFDKKGNLIIVEYGDLQKTKFKYDNYGNVIEEKAYDENGELSTNEKYLYKFDKQRNWYEKIKFEDNEPTFIIERKIEYYK